MRESRDCIGTSPKSFKTYSRSRSLRLPGFDYASSHVYFITLGTHERRPVFANARYAEAIADCLRSCRTRDGFVVYAYCLMPDHAHLLITPVHGGKALSSFIGAFKSLSTRTFWNQRGEGRLWQGHYFDHVVRDEESLSAIAGYIWCTPSSRQFSSHFLLVSRAE